MMWFPVARVEERGESEEAEMLRVNFVILGAIIIPLPKR